MKVAIIDLDSICWGACFGIKLLDEQGNPLKCEKGNFVYRDKVEEEVYQSLDFTMNGVFSKTEATHYVAYIKGKNTIKARLAVNPSYKKNRSGEEPPLYEIAKKYLIDTWSAVEVNNMEVDDAVAITYNLLKEEGFIVAIDGDLLALQTKHPHFNWRKEVWLEVDEEQAAYKFWSDMICGQTGDNIFGLKGRGPAYVKKHFQPGLISIQNYPSIVLNLYIVDLGLVKGVDEYYKNYKSLTILQESEGFIIPSLSTVSISTLPVDLSGEELPNFD